METSTEGQRNGEETYHFYSPCHFFERAIRAFLRCLGHDSCTEQAQDPPPHAERQIKSSEYQFVVNATKRSKASRRPPRPHLSSGRGGQIHKSSS